MCFSNAPYEPTARRKIELSRHAAKRSKQRAISEAAVPLILAYGERSHDGRGGTRYVMTQRAIETLIRVIGHTQKTESLAGCYAVVDAESGDTIITLGHRHQ